MLREGEHHLVALLVVILHSNQLTLLISLLLPSLAFPCRNDRGATRTI